MITAPTGVSIDLCTAHSSAPPVAVLLRFQAAIEQLDLWARQAEADIALVEALSGAPLAATDSVAAALPQAVHTDAQGNTVLSRCVLRYCAAHELIEVLNALMWRAASGRMLPLDVAGTARRVTARRYAGTSELLMQFDH